MRRGRRRASVSRTCCRGWVSNLSVYNLAPYQDVPFGSGHVNNLLKPDHLPAPQQLVMSV